jgi:hypothetical protein
VCRAVSSLKRRDDVRNLSAAGVSRTWRVGEAQEREETSGDETSGDDELGRWDGMMGWGDESWEHPWDGVGDDEQRVTHLLR